MFSLTSEADHRTLTMSLTSNHNNSERKYHTTPNGQRKFSDQSSLNPSRHSSLKHQTSTPKPPRELKVEYSAVSQKAVVKESNVTDNQVIYVYCSPRLKQTLIFLFKFVLLVYCVTIPIFVYLLHHKSNINIEKLNRFEVEFERHLENVASTKTRGNIVNDINTKEEGKRRKRDTANGNKIPTEELGRKIFERDYSNKKLNNSEFTQTLTIFNETVRRYKKR